MHVLLDDDRGQLTVKRIWPWHQILSRIQAARLDRALAAGTSPEASASLAARAAQLTSTGFRRDLAASVRRILVAAGSPALPVAAGPPALPGAAGMPALPLAAHALLGSARPSRLPLDTARIGRSAPLLAEVASRLLEPAASIRCRAPAYAIRGGSSGSSSPKCQPSTPIASVSTSADASSI